jgi:hypothetical protein
MKINLIPTKKLALLSAALCAAMLAFTNNASAVTNLTLSDPHNLGEADSQGSFVPSDAGKTSLVNILIGMNPNSSLQPVTVEGNAYNLFRGGNGFGALPTAVFASNGGGTSIPIGTGVYSYLWAQYTLDAVTFGVVWYIGDLSGDLTIPPTVFNGRVNYVLAGWTLFGAGGQGVPDGGTTVMLLGAALGALGMARRFLKA